MTRGANSSPTAIALRIRIGKPSQRDAAIIQAHYHKAIIERSTAAVFHLMRAMEIAVRVVGEKLAATVSNEHGETLPWGIIVANVKPKIDAMPRGPKQDEWYKVHALLHSVNRSFRTKTAHPAHKYDAEEAENVFNATKAFMQELAGKVL